MMAAAGPPPPPYSVTDPKRPKDAGDAGEPSGVQIVPLSQSYIQFVPFAQPTASTNFMLQQHGNFVVVDFYPKCVARGWKGSEKPPKFEPFSELVRQANYWLFTNPTFRVLRCESFERESDWLGRVRQEDCVEFESGLGSNLYVRALRLWCLSQPGAEVPQQIWYVNVVPQSRSAGLALGTAVHDPRFGYEGIMETVACLNEQLAQRPLPGWVLTLEQVELKLSAGTRLGAFDLDESCWLVHADRGRYFLSCMRLFYVLDPAAPPERVGVAVIAPQGTVKPMSRSHWSSFRDVMISSANFILQNPNLHITNIQTVKYPVTVPQNTSGPAVDLTVNVDPTFHVFSPEATCVYAVWIGYSMRPTPAQTFASGQVTCRTFLPCKVGGASYESVGSCLSRISTWMYLTGNKLVSAETFSVYHNPNHDVVHDEKMSYDPIKGSLGKRLTLFRLFFDGPVVEPPPHLLPPPPKFKTSSICSIL